MEDLQKNRAELIKELEGIFKRRVFAIIYNPHYEESKRGIQLGDQKPITYFIENIIRKERVKDCVFILNGFGGNLKAAVWCSEILRNNLDYYMSFVPTVAGSSVCYFVLQSNRLLIGDKSILTQIDPIFDYQGQEYRAIKNLNDKNPEIKELAHEAYNPIFENLKRVILTPPHVFQKEVYKQCQKKTNFFVKAVDLLMGKDFHESGLTIKDLNTLKIDYIILKDEIVEKAKILVNKCQGELVSENRRFIIQTNKIDEGCFGGYFFP